MRDYNEKKTLQLGICIALILNLIVFGSFSFILFRIIPDYQYPFYPYGETLKVARTSNPLTMDPVDSWDSASNDMLDQVLETLLAYDLSDPDLPLVGRLAESWYWADNRTIVFQLRENVFFHDGSRFTADCVLYTIKRIGYFGNWSGTLPSTERMALPHSLYKFRDGTPIFNDTLSFATDDYNVTLVLNRPYSPAEGLLTYTASSIVSNISTPMDKMLDKSSDLVIGTGPFKLIRYIPNQEVRFARWERYWRTGPYWDYIVYVYYPSAINTNNAMLAGDIDYLGQGIESFKHDFEIYPYITITGDGVHDYINGSTYWYVGFNTEIINQTWRKAMLYALNYTNVIEVLKQNMVYKANSLVPPGFLGHNASGVGGTYNIPKARQIMQSMGFGYTDGVPWDVGAQIGDQFIPGANETLWLTAEFIPMEGTFTDNNFNFHYYPSYFMTLFMDQFNNDMHLIGIKAAEPVHRFQWIIPPSPEELHIFFAGWSPEYIETFNMIEPLVDPESPSNIGKINNTEINALLEITTAELNTSRRHEYYKKLQYLIHDKYYYQMPLFYDKIYYVHASSLKGFPYNFLIDLYFYPTYRGF
ncbi:MAG: ABC transporter substrate-binding protein [Candidatus Odinarchaeota archaeon]